MILSIKRKNHEKTKQTIKALRRELAAKVVVVVVALVVVMMTVAVADNFNCDNPGTTL